MSSDDRSELLPDYGDLEEARESEIDALTPPAPPSSWHRWVAVAALGGFGVAAFIGAWILSAGIPSDGDAAVEARVTALVTAGGTSIGAAVAIAAVVLTLGLHREQEQWRRWADFQVDTLGEAHEWIDQVYRQFGRIQNAMEEWHNALDQERSEKLRIATARAQSFYDNEQRLSEVERLERLIADRAVRSALRLADGALRGWNEAVAGDHTSREVRLLDADGSEWTVLGSLADARDVIVRAYSAAVGDALRGPAN